MISRKVHTTLLYNKLKLWMLLEHTSGPSSREKEIVFFWFQGRLLPKLTLHRPQPTERDLSPLPGNLETCCLLQGAHKVLGHLPGVLYCLWSCLGAEGSVSMYSPEAQDGAGRRQVSPVLVGGWGFGDREAERCRAGSSPF